VAKAAAAASGAVTRTMGAAKFAVAKASTAWTSRTDTASTTKLSVEINAASGRETPCIQNLASERQSNVHEMGGDTNGTSAMTNDRTTGAMMTDSEFTSIGLAGFGDQPTPMEDDEMVVQKEWQSVEERALDQGAYRVQYEYSKKMDLVARSTSFELRSLALELWRADPYLEIASFNPLMYPILGIDSFPVSTEDYQRFFARMSTEKNGQQLHIFGFTIRTMHPLSVLTQRNGKALQGFLTGRKTWLRQQKISTLLVEPIGWFACKILGAHTARMEYLDENEFGTFMLLTTRLSNPELQRDMYQKHLAFTQDLVAIAVEGLHLDVLEEPIPSGSAAAVSTSVRQILLQLERDGEYPIKSIKYTTRSRDEGRFLFVTDREGAAYTERITNNELMDIAGRTRAFASHLHDNEKFADGTRRAAGRLTRRELHETGVRARHGSVNGKEQSRARQSRRQVVIIDAPWTLDDHPPLTQRKEPAATHEPRNYAQAVIGQIPQKQPDQQYQQQSGLQQQPANQGRSSPTNRSLTSDLGDDDTATILTLLSTVAEQQVQIQSLIDGNKTFKENVHKAVELRMKDQQARNVIALEEIETRQKKTALEHQQQLQEKDVHYQNKMLSMMNQFNARDLAQLEAKQLADEQQRLRDEAIQLARVAERSEYETTTARILLEMRQMMTAIAPQSINMQQQATTTP
jgi:hypothetical protein